jgi:3-methylcrotonyl-CoA carboxylase alpha subunit
MRYVHDGITHAVDLEPLEDGRYRVTLGDETQVIEARRLPDGGWLLVMHGQQMIAYCAAQGDARYIHCVGQTWTLTIPDDRPRRRGLVGAAGDLTAQMPGQVREVLVVAGDEVAAGQPLIILEAMKMEIRVSAPAPGIVRAVRVQVGDVVERGQRLLEMDSSPPTAS